MTTPTRIDDASVTATLADALKTQLHASLAMLRETIEKCPDELWLDSTPKNAFWQVAYHTLFFAHFYLGKDEASFVPWADHQRDVQHEDGIPGDADPRSPLPLIARPYSREQALRYWAIVDEMVDRCVDALDYSRRDSGFHYRMPKLEHQIVNIRHIQHHAAQLADRLRAAEDVHIRWVGGSRPTAG